MRKIFTISISVAAMLFFSACSKQETVSLRDGKEPIDFTVYSGRGITKTLTDVTSENLTSFQVMAYLSKSADGYPKYFTYEQTATKQTSGTYSGKWTTGTTFFWPVSDKLDFFAYKTKYDATLDKTSGQYPTLAYNVNSSLDDDLVVAKATAQSKQDSQPLTFKHALAKINSITFKAKDGDVAATSSYKYHVESFVIGSAKYATYNYETGLWTGVTGSGTYRMDGFVGNDNYIFTGEESATIKDSGQNVSTAALLPGETKFAVEYSIGYLATNSTEVTIMPLTKKSVTMTLIQGYSYNITFILSNDASPITFTATVADWDTGDAVDKVVE